MIILVNEAQKGTRDVPDLERYHNPRSVLRTNFLRGGRQSNVWRHVIGVDREVIDFKCVEVGDENPAGGIRFSNDAVLAHDAHTLKAARIHYGECVIHRRRGKDSAVDQRDCALGFEPERSVSLDPIGPGGEPCPG